MHNAKVKYSSEFYYLEAYIYKAIIIATVQ